MKLVVVRPEASLIGFAPAVDRLLKYGVDMHPSSQEE
jgi:hypothetical protein